MNGQTGRTGDQTTAGLALKKTRCNRAAPQTGRERAGPGMAPG
jgi:hypothetical protein